MIASGEEIFHLLLSYDLLLVAYACSVSLATCIWPLLMEFSRFLKILEHEVESGCRQLNGRSWRENLKKKLSKCIIIIYEINKSKF